MIRINREKLLEMSVSGEISHPLLPRSGYDIGADGKARLLPGVGGITYNYRIGDPACGLAADHVEPGASVKQGGKGNERENAALNLLACVGNRAKVVSGDAKGGEGFVTGKHGGIEHVIVDFEKDVLEKLNIGDKVLIRAHGVGMELPDYPEIKVMNCSPDLFEAVNPGPIAGGRIEVGVAMVIPAAIMGSGLGHDSCHSGDYDIQMFDGASVERYGLARLRIGDLVAIMDADNSYGRIYLKGAVTVGVVVHSDSTVSGHGPGVTTLLTSGKGLIKPVTDAGANLKALLKPARKVPGKRNGAGGKKK